MATGRLPCRGARAARASRRSSVRAAFRAAAVLPIVAAAAASALAQDYDVTETSGQYVTVPSDATVLTFINPGANLGPSNKVSLFFNPNNVVRGQDDGISGVDLPFRFTYYGAAYERIRVCTNGFVLFN